MTNPVPLLIVMGTIVALVGVQRVLTRIGHRLEAPPPAPIPPKPRGRTLFNGLSATGLDERGIEHLKNLIKSKDSSVLAAFLATNRPGIIELDAYLRETRTLFLNSLPDLENKSSEKNIRKGLKSFTPALPPGGIHLDVLDSDELREIFTFEPTSQRLVTRELMAQFGGSNFSNCFEYYCAHEKSVTLHVPPLDPGRPILETLAKSGVADKGRLIPLPVRLTVLKMNQLRQMAKDLNRDIKFTRKDEAVETLAQIPGAAVLLSMQYIVDDLFVLKPLKDDPENIQQEWTYLTAYAKLLISRMNPVSTPAK